MKTHQLIWLLIWSVLAVAFFIGQHAQRIERINHRNHELVEASMTPPSTIQIKTR